MMSFGRTLPGRPARAVTLALGLVCTMVLSPAIVAQSPTQLLLDKAHQQEARGRTDMAVQTWQQVLLADPNNPGALAGLARAAKLEGNESLADAYIERLRSLNPNDPQIARTVSGIEAMSSQLAQNTDLQQAGRLASAGQYSQAMALYRKVFGTSPPAGDWSLAYYETEGATPEGRAHAIAALKALAERNPRDSRYTIALGRLLTYSPKTRAEGRRYLERYPADPQAVEALQQSLQWDAEGATARQEGTRAHGRSETPSGDGAHTSERPEYPARLGTASKARAASNASKSEEDDLPINIAERPGARQRLAADEAAAYRALNAKRTDEAEQRFRVLLAINPVDPRALAGMGYVRLMQANFAGAISYLVQARQEGAKDAGLERALDEARFWYTMGEGALALKQNDLPTAEKQYKFALGMRPNSAEALEGLGGTLLKAEQAQAAVQVFARDTQLRPTAPAAWRGLIQAQSLAGHPAAALQSERRIPASVRSELALDPDYLRTLASCYSAVGQDAEAQAVLRRSLDLPFPPGGQGLKADTQLEYASLLIEANHLDQAGGLCRQVLAEDPSNLAAWQGLVRVQHAQSQDAVALQTLSSMSPQMYEVALRDPGFQMTVAAIYQEQNKLPAAQELLEHSLSQQVSLGARPPVPMQLQLAAIYLAENDSKRAFPIYRQILAADPQRTDAWRGLLSALHDAGRDREALAEIQQIPPVVRRDLESQVEYLQTVAAIYNALGDPREATVFLNRVQQHYAIEHTAAPASTDIQSAWLQFNAMNDAGLYRQLMELGSRPDLTEAEAHTVQVIWTSWAVRRANQAAAAGNSRRSLAILNAAADAFPDNPAVLRALASGYVRAGLPKQAVVIYKAQNLTAASASDYKAAIGAALAADDLKDAETWLRYGLDQYPKDAQMLLLGAQFEQRRGATNRAADYYRASLAAMPAVDPGAELAAELRHSGSDRLPGRDQASSLAALLQPGADPRGAAAAYGNSPLPVAPYLPSYSNVYGDAPVQLPTGTTPGGYNAVPSYMNAPPASDQPPPATLKDYVPHAALELPQGGFLPPQLTPVAERRAALDRSLVKRAATLPPADRAESRTAEQNQNPGSAYISAPFTTLPPAKPTTASSPQTGILSSRTGGAVPVSQPNGIPSARPGYLTGQPGPLTAQPDPALGRDTSSAQPAEPLAFGPYIPYVAPPAKSTYVPARTTVVLHDPTVYGTPPPPHEITDVLPSAHYLPNADAGQPPPVATVTTTNVPSGPDIAAPGTQNIQVAGIQAGAPQLPQPSTPSVAAQPRPDETRTGQSRPPSTSTLQSPGASEGQQYSQPAQFPGSTARPQRPTAPRRQAAPAVPRTATNPQPGPVSGPAMTYPAAAPPIASPATAAGGGPPPTDAELMSRAIPPLRGGYDQRQPATPGQPLSERDQAALDLARLEGSYSGWVGGTGYARYRSGTVGIDRLVDFEAPFEASLTVGNAVRFSVIPRAVLLRSGALDTTMPASYAYLGSLPTNATTAPAEQTSTGVGGELQMTTRNIGLAVGYTPYEFLVANVTGRASWRPASGPFTLFGVRDAVKETQLSYAGLRDPGSASPTYAGNIWGGVVSTGGGVRFDHSMTASGVYLYADGASLTGYHVLQNTKFEGGVGAYFQVFRWPEYGSLNIGGSFFGMHYSHNERGLSYGSGGYFSPEAYFLADVPITFTGHYGQDLHYSIGGAAGLQAFQEAAAPYFALDPALQTAALSGCTNAQLTNKTCGYYTQNSSAGANYNLDARIAYRVADHWYLGAFLTANNSNNYNTVTGGFSARYLFRPQYPTEDYPTGIFPQDGFRPLRIP
jgi:predicted Zn-dependent protease